MNIIIFSVAFLVALILVYTLQLKESRRRSAEAGTDEGVRREQMWTNARTQTDSAIEGMFLAAARPFSVTPLVEDSQNSSVGKYIQARLLASGGTFANSVEIFFSVQAFAAVVAVLLVIGGLAADSDLIKAACALGAFGVIAYPWNIVSSRAKKRSSAIIEELPAFSELLQMYLASGRGDILSALSFTAQRTQGVVSTTVSAALSAQLSGALTVEEAFTAAGEELGTPSTRTYFQTLLSAYLHGDRVVDSIAAQSAILRDAAYQAQRARIKEVPVKLLVATAIHLFPLLLVLGLLPAAVELSRV